MADAEQKKTKRGRGPLSEAEWAAVQADFESGETNVSKLSKKHGVSRGAIIVHRDTGKWTVKEHAKEQIADQARSNVIDMATRQAIEKMGGADALDKLSTEMAITMESVLAEQIPILSKAAKLLNRTLDRALLVGKPDEALTADEKLIGKLIVATGQGETAIVNDLLGAIAKFTDKGRLMNGLVPGVANVMQEPDVDNAPAESLVLVVRGPKESPPPEAATA